jgi:hypothetical protein
LLFPPRVGEEAGVRDSGGFTIIEAAIALGLAAATAVSVAAALATSRAVGVQARDDAIGVIAARARLAELQALRFDVRREPDGTLATATDATTDVTTDPPSAAGTGLAASPPDALWRDRAGYVDYLDASGRAIGIDAAAARTAAYVRRWRIGRQGRAAAEVAPIAVLVAPAAVAARVAAGGTADRLAEQQGVVVLGGAVVRRPS